MNSNLCYRLYTEKKNQAGLECLINRFFQSFTMIEGIGYHQGNREDCLVIEIIAPAMPNLDQEIERLGNAIVLFNTQNSILITKGLIELI